jgi:hypothetical protein
VPRCSIGSAVSRWQQRRGDFGASRVALAANPRALEGRKRKRRAPSGIPASGSSLRRAVIHRAASVLIDGSVCGCPILLSPPRPQGRRDRALDPVLHVVNRGQRPASPFHGLRRDRPLHRPARMHSPAHAARDQQPGEEAHVIHPWGSIGSPKWYDRAVPPPSSRSADIRAGDGVRGQQAGNGRPKRPLNGCCKAPRSTEQADLRACG